MTRVGSPLVGAASQATGLPPFVIDNWIGNYRRKKTSSSQPKNKKLHTKDLSGYNLFCRDLLKNKGSLKDITQKWSTLGEVEKRKYAEEAAALKVQRTSDDMSPETRSLKVKKHLKQIKTEVASLEKLGVETGVMMFDHQKPFLDVLEVSSKGASSFFDRTDVLDNFALHFKGNSSSTSAVKQPVDTMVKKVQELFNRKYNEAGGRGRLPYISIQNESIIINASGLPDGITLKKPCHYGRKQLEVILKNAEQISFQINSGRKIRPTVEDIFNVMCGNDMSASGSSGKRKSYTVEYKKAIVEESWGKNVVQFCKEKMLDHRLVQKWRAEYTNLSEKVESGMAKKRKIGCGRQPMYTELESLVSEWVADRRAKTLVVTRAQIQEYALAVSPQFDISPEQFKASQHWVDNFLERNDLSLRRSTTLFRLEDAEIVKRALAYKKFVDDIDFSKYSLCNMIAMDEIAVFMGQAAQTTIDRGASSVYVPSTAYESARVTCILTIRLDGTKATPLLIAKGKKEKIERVSGIYVLETEKAWATQDVIRK
uniref:HTH CENPB-type domain-containing protein n=1 Tax=Poecilia mexicana TaxID=48701 RepID=A0A3B3Y323_9TELE